jgi:hypothetical protein
MMLGDNVGFQPPIVCEAEIDSKKRTRNDMSFGLLCASYKVFFSAPSA